MPREDLRQVFASISLGTKTGLPKKLDAREVELEALHPRRLTARKEEFRADWERSLAALLPPGAVREFEEVWDRVAPYVGRIAQELCDVRGEEE